MFFTIHHPVVRFVIIGIFTTGMLTGCSGSAPAPSIPTSVEEVKQEAKDLGGKAAEFGKNAAKKLHDVLAEEVPDIKVHFEKLKVRSEELYCAAKAESAEAAAAVKKEIQTAWNQLVVGHPSYAAPKLDLDGAACE